jgi:hypothetical protein
VPPAHFDEARAKRALWQEFRDHDASINNALTEALWIHEGPSWRIFQVSVFVRLEVHSLIWFVFAHFLILLSPAFFDCR